jgi:hypothetical protein
VAPHTTAAAATTDPGECTYNTVLGSELALKSGKNTPEHLSHTVTA